MLYEYSVDPYCMGDWGTFRFLTAGFGVSCGRLISEFPKKWLRKTDEICRINFSFRQKQMVAEELKRIKKYGLIYKNRPYKDNITWFSNAIANHKQDPFHAIITDTQDTIPDYVLRAKEITRNTPRWDIPSGSAVPRTIKDLCFTVGPLLQISEHILFVDKMFDPVVSRWKDLFQQFVSIATDGRRTPPIIEYHFMIKDDDLDDGGKKLNFSDYCTVNMSKIIPKDLNIKFCRRDIKLYGEGMHARYILTEKGGINIDWGLDVGKQGETTDVSLLDEHLWKRRYQEYSDKSAVFETIDEITVTGK